MTKICSKCQEEKPKEFFRSRGGSQKHLLKSYCNSCLQQDHKKWVSSNQETVKRYRAKDKWTLKKRCSRHGITPEEFWAMYEEQDGCCPICDEVVEAEDSAIDHNHETGQVRGILCKTCNRALGLLKDSPSNLSRAFDYLTERGHYG